MIASPPSCAVHSLVLVSRLAVLFLTFSSVLCWKGRTSVRAFQTEGRVATLSAASYAPTVAPESIVAVFGNQLTSPGTALQGFDTQPDTSEIELPTLLGDITAEINGRSAGLMFVSPGQVNCVVPKDLEPGTGSVIIRNLSGSVVASGEIEISPLAPAIFTANGTGEGVPAALIYRIKTDGTVLIEPPFQFSPEQMRFVTRPIDLGPEGELVFLVLYLTGAHLIDDARTTRLLIGGAEFTPDFIGSAPGFIGLEQINFQLPRHLHGKLKFAVAALGYATSNICEIEIAEGVNSTLSITALSRTDSLAGEELEITGSGFAPDSEVLIADVNRTLSNAELTELSATKIKVRIPFGAGSGSLIVRNHLGRATHPFTMRSSISGIVQTTQEQPDGSDRRIAVTDATVRLAGLNLPAVRTNGDGSFLIPDVPATNLIIEVDGTTAGMFAKEYRQITALAGRDNSYSQYIELQATTGTSVPSSVAPDQTFSAVDQTAGQSVPVTFEPMGSTIKLPDGTPVDSVKVTSLPDGRAPADLPSGHFSSSIVQITPFGAEISPGGRLTFPNADGLPPGSTATLFRFDQTAGSSTRGKFIASGDAQVSTDGQQIITASNAVKESTYYFVSALKALTTVYGSVVMEDGRPARGALVSARGQSVFASADESAAFILTNVPILGEEPFTVEVTLLQPDGSVDRSQREGLQHGVGLTFVSPPLELPGKQLKLAPVILAPLDLAVEAGKTTDFSFIAFPGATGATLSSVTVVGAGFASILNVTGDRYALHLTPGTGAVGTYHLIIKATDTAGRTFEHKTALEVRTAPGNGLIANSQSLVTDEDVPIAIMLGGVGGSAFRVTSLPSRGSLDGTAPNLVYIPSENFSGLDSLSFVVGNQAAESAAGVISIAVRPVNESPSLEAQASYTIGVGEPLHALIFGSDVDVGQKLTLEAAGLPPGASLSQLTGTSWLLSWTQGGSEPGSYAINLLLKDDAVPQMSVEQTMTIIVATKWMETAGPVEADVRAFAVLGTTLFAGTNGCGVFRSMDHGTTWTRLSPGLTSHPVSALSVNGGSVFAGTPGGGVFRSSDLGATWSPVNTGLTFLSVSALVVNGDAVIAGTSAGVFRTINHGASWAVVGDGLSAEQVSSLGVSGDTIFAGTNSGVFRIGNQEASWTKVSNGLTTPAVLSLLVTGATVFAGTNGGGVFRSSDQGANWTAVNVNLTGLQVTSLALSANIVFAGTSTGLFRSADLTLGWNAIDSSPASLDVSALAVSAGGVFAGATIGVFRTTGLGASLTEADAGLICTQVEALLVSGTAVFAGTSTGKVFRSADQGTNWTTASGGLDARRVHAFVLSGTTIFAGTNAGAFRTIDQGLNWTSVNVGLMNRAVFALAISGSALFAGTDVGVYRSTDQGANWTAVNNGLPGGFVFALVGSGNTMFAATDGGVFRSPDQGGSWVQVNNGLPFGGVSRLLIDGAALFAGTSAGVYRTTDAGDNWNPVNNGLPAGSILAMAAGGNRVFAAVAFGGGVYRSADQGASWSALNVGLVNRTVLSLAISGSTVLAGTTTGVFSRVAE